MTSQVTAAGVRVLAAGAGEVLGDPAGVRDRFMVDGADSGGRFALVQHLFAPRSLAAPMHRHRQEDEFTFVLTGRIGAVLGDQEVVGEPGDLIFKPRDQWHTFWNAGDEPASVLEIISPAGLEQLFRIMGSAVEPIDDATFTGLEATYGCEADMARTQEVLERHRLVF